MNTPALRNTQRTLPSAALPSVAAKHQPPYTQGPPFGLRLCRSPWGAGGWGLTRKSGGSLGVSKHAVLGLKGPGLGRASHRQTAAPPTRQGSCARLPCRPPRTRPKVAKTGGREASPASTYGVLLPPPPALDAAGGSTAGGELLPAGLGERARQRHAQTVVIGRQRETYCWGHGM